MDHTALVDRDIDEGRKLVQALDAEAFSVVAALWYFFSDEDVWRLIIASTKVADDDAKDESDHCSQEAAEWRLVDQANRGPEDHSVEEPSYVPTGGFLLRHKFRPSRPVSTFMFSPRSNAAAHPISDPVD